MISLDTSLRVLRRYALALVISLLLGAEVGSLIGARITNRYTSQQLLTVIPQNARDLAELSQVAPLAAQHANVLTSVLRSPQALEQAARNAEITSLAGTSVRVDHTVGSTDLIVQTTAPDSASTRRLSDEIGKFALAESRRQAPSAANGLAAVTATLPFPSSEPSMSGLSPRLVWPVLMAVALTAGLYLALLSAWLWRDPVNSRSQLWVDRPKTLLGTLTRRKSVRDIQTVANRAPWSVAAVRGSIVALAGPKSEAITSLLQTALIQRGLRVAISPPGALERRGNRWLRAKGTTPAQREDAQAALRVLQAEHDLVFLACPNVDSIETVLADHVTVVVTEDTLSEREFSRTLDALPADKSAGVILVQRGV